MPPAENKPFFLACQMRFPLEVTVQLGGERPQTAQVGKPHILIGSTAGADALVGRPGVAPRQTYFQMIEGRVFAVHLGGDVPTYRNGRKLASGWVSPTDTFVVGNATVQFGNPDQRPADREESADNPLTGGATGDPGYMFEPLDGNTNGAAFHSRRKLLLVGRGGPAKIRVRHQSISQLHAAILSQAGDLWVVDLASRYGVFVNGRPVAAAPLFDRDELTFGEVKFRVRPGIPAPTGVSVAVPDTPPPVGGALAPVTPPPAVSLALASPPAAAGPTFDQMALLQKQSHEQFQQTLGVMMQMVNGVLADHREFVREEMARVERILTSRAAAPAAPPPPPPPPPPPAPPGIPFAPKDAAPLPAPVPPKPATFPQLATPVPTDETAAHKWLEKQFGELEAEHTNLWQRLKKKLVGD